jgi:phytoene dehydrogenase-like protein
MGPNAPPIPLAVVGGGISGIAAALDLARSRKFAVTLFEREDELGGLCASTVWRGMKFDKYYHVLLPADAHTIAFIEDLGLGGELLWRPARSGFLGGGQLVPFASAGDFLRFPFLTPRQKLKLGWGILSDENAPRPRRAPGRRLAWRRLRRLGLPKILGAPPPEQTRRGPRPDARGLHVGDDQAALWRSRKDERPGTDGLPSGGVRSPFPGRDGQTPGSGSDH